MSEKLLKWKYVFITDLIVSSLVYSLLMINQLVNQLDGIWHGSVSYANGWELSLGRWLLRFLDRFHFYLSPDPLSSFICLILLSASVIMVLDIFEVSDKATMYVASLLFMINVSVCICLSYRYTSMAFAFSCFLGVLSAYILIKLHRRPLLSIILSAVCCALMLGTYQADIGCTAVILLLYIPFRLHRNDMQGRDFMKYILKIICAMVPGAVLYAILLRINLIYYEMTLSSYHGASSYGIRDMITHIPQSIAETYSSFIAYYSNTGYKTNLLSPKFYLLLYVLILIYMLFGLFAGKDKKPLKSLLYLLCIAVMPVFANIVCLAAYKADTSIQMTFPFCLCLPLMLCLISDLKPDLAIIQKAGRYAILALSLLVLYGAGMMTLYDQQAMYMGRNSTRVIVEEVTETLIKEDLFSVDDKHCFVGSPAGNMLFYKNDAFYKANVYASFGSWDATDASWASQSWKGFFTHEMGSNFGVVSEEEYKALIQDERVRSLPVYPAKGSCVKIDDTVVVKISDY